jgi:hypothetical protein
MIDRCGIIDIIMALVTSIVLLLAFTVAAGDDIPPYSTKYFSQYINHFDFSNSDKFQQKVLVMRKAASLYYMKNTDYCNLNREILEG